MFNPYFTVTSVLIYSAITFGGAGIALVRGFRSVDVERWAAAHGLSLTPQTRPVVAKRLQGGRRIRTVGFVAGWCVPYAVLWYQRDMREEVGPLASVAFVVGYLLAAVLAEFWYGRGEPRSGAASLERRSLEAYLPGWARTVPRMAAVGALLLVVVYAYTPWRDEGFGPSVGAFLRSALLVVLVVAAIEMLERYVVARRQPFSSAALVEIDDAFRSASVNILAGVAIAFTASLWSSLLWQLGARTDVQLLRWTTPFLGLALVVLGLRAFAILSDPMLQWRVRRHSTVRQSA